MRRYLDQKISRKGKGNMSTTNFCECPNHSPVCHNEKEEDSMFCSECNYDPDKATEDRLNSAN